jgi:hypothetical protein
MQRALAEDLAGLLRRASMSGKALAEQLGWQPSKISKIIRCKQLPSREDVDLWARACGAPEEVEPLVALLRAVQTQRVEWRHRMRGGLAPVQVDYNRLHAQSHDIRYFEMVVIPGPLQIRAYARRLLTWIADLNGSPSVDIDAAVATRLQRQQYLYEPDRQYTFLIAEPALRWGLCPPEIMRPQLDRLLSAAELPTVTLAILPLGQPISAIPQHSFQIYDDSTIVETATTELAFRDDEAEPYARLFTQLLDDAVTGDKARKLIIAAIEALPHN